MASPFPRGPARRPRDGGNEMPGRLRGVLAPAAAPALIAAVGCGRDEEGPRVLVLDAALPVVSEAEPFPPTDRSSTVTLTLRDGIAFDGKPVESNQALLAALTARANALPREVD